MNENLAEVIRRYEQERSWRPGARCSDRESRTAPDQSCEGLGATAPRLAPCGHALKAVPQRGNPHAPTRATQPQGLSVLPGAYDLDWMTILSRIHTVGLASIGCLACDMIGGEA